MRYNGDINNDGKINADDLAELKKAIAGATTAEILQYCDYNKDGAVNAKDLSALKKFISKIAKYDVNQDGVVDENDVNALKQFIEGTNVDAISKDAADVNEDGKVDIKDIAALKQFFKEFEPIEFEHTDETVMELSNGKEGE